jgi:hypothetical protein
VKPHSEQKFVVYAITYDDECFGLYATRVEAETAFARQLAEGGPAWEDCHVNPWWINGEPEVHRAE